MVTETDYFGSDVFECDLFSVRTPTMETFEKALHPLEETVDCNGLQPAATSHFCESI